MKSLKGKTEIKKQNTKLFVGLGSHIDILRWKSLSTNVKIEQLSYPNDLEYFEVKSYEYAYEMVRNYKKTYNLGASTFDGGLAKAENRNFNARVSYNGRVWDNKDWSKSKKIEIC